MRAAPVDMETGIEASLPQLGRREEFDYVGLSAQEFSTSFRLTRGMSLVLHIARPGRVGERWPEAHVRSDVGKPQ